MPRVRVEYDANGTEVVYLKGYRISSQSWPSGALTIKIFNKKGKRVRVLQVARYYSCEWFK